MSIFAGCQLSALKKNSAAVAMELGEVPWLSEAAEKYKPRDKDMLCEMYVLQYYVDFEKKEFTGDVKIHINLLSVIPFIVLDKGRCTIEELSVRRGNDYIDIDGAYDYTPKEKLIICLSRKLIPGKYKIVASVRGDLSEKPEGFFLINHSRDRLFAMTHFWPDHAKHVFPCFNDPAFKSVFIISLVRPTGLGFKAISNMKPEKRISDYPSEKLTTIYFMATPPLQVMSLTMIIGNLVTSDPSQAKLGYTVSVSCREELINRTKEVQDMICSIMGVIGKFIRTQFNLTKIDVVALPIQNFPPYCMGNPGVIVFNEHEICSVSDKTAIYYTRVVRKMIHEVMHMWMGNMMTSVSWEHYWLYEGIVGYMCQILGSQMFPSWYTEWITLHYDLQPAMEVEPWFPSTLSNAMNREKPPNLNSLAAQTLFYGKSTSCLRMMGSMDFTNFRFQMTQFFSHKGDISRKKLLYENVDSVLETKRLENMIFSWQDTESFPLVTVVVNGTGKVSLEQKPFGRKSTHKTEDQTSTSSNLMMIPMLYFELEDPKRIKTIWFEEEGHPILLQTVLRPFKLNWHQSGYYRVNYTKDMWAHFASVMNEEEKTLDTEDKANLIDDAFALAEYGHIHHGVPLSLVVYLRSGNETHPLPWMMATKHLERIYHRTLNTQITYLLEMLVKMLIQSYLENESIWTLAKQPIPDVIRKLAIINLGGTFLNEDVIERLKYVLNNFLEEDTISMELKKATFAHGYGK
uniref:Thyrotropin-releasing hormone-degrading ectoenzyme n=3 Tax=Lygus hesperus TaxID=30085 RepID=A0A0A9W414_LYGHE